MVVHSRVEYLQRTEFLDMGYNPCRYSMFFVNSEIQYTEVIVAERWAITVYIVLTVQEANVIVTKHSPIHPS